MLRLPFGNFDMDKEGRVWGFVRFVKPIRTNIFRFTPESGEIKLYPTIENEAGIFRNFTMDDGLPGNEFNRYSSRRFSNGLLFFEGVDGFVCFDPKAVLNIRSQVRIVFMELTIANKKIEWKNSRSMLSHPLFYAEKVTLQPGQNIFSVGFASLDFRGNSKKYYKYRLEGFDDCQDVVNRVMDTQPDLILMDIDMPYVNGIEGVRLIRQHFPEVKILMQTVFEDEEKLFACIRAGADGYVLKKEPSDRLISAMFDALERRGSHDTQHFKAGAEVCQWDRLSRRISGFYTDHQGKGSAGTTRTGIQL